MGFKIARAAALWNESCNLKAAGNGGSAMVKLRPPFNRSLILARRCGSNRSDTVVRTFHRGTLKLGLTKTMAAPLLA
jgi:hypothetical protein